MEGTCEAYLFNWVCFDSTAVLMVWSRVRREMELILVFFFKQKTAYEVAIGDWSSDVCSPICAGKGARLESLADALKSTAPLRSEERRVGKEGRSRWAPYH